jgi:pyridoxine kinase
MNLLSIHSHVAYGHVGNAAAVFVLQRMGVEVWPIHTLQFSNHPGYGQHRGRVFDGALVRELVAGIEARGVLGQCDGVLSGYLGTEEIGEAIFDTVGAVKRANPAARYCCDPVIGDLVRGVYVREGVAAFMRDRLVPLADVVTPNQFELEILSGRPSDTLAAARNAIDALHGRGPTAVLVTSLKTDDTPADCIDMIASEESGQFRLRTPRLALDANGAGDAVAALFFAHYLRSGQIVEALAQAGSAIFGILQQTANAGARELQLVAAQDEIVAPSRLFAPERLA